MAAFGPAAQSSYPRGHGPAVFALSGRSTQVPVDQEPGARVWDLQLMCQGAFVPHGILRTFEGELWVPSMGE